MVGITSFGGYVPRYRLNRMIVFGSMGWLNPVIIMNAQGEKAVANFDEDSITMAVAAGMDCLRGVRPLEHRRGLLRHHHRPLQGEAEREHRGGGPGRGRGDPHRRFRGVPQGGDHRSAVGPGVRRGEPRHQRRGLRRRLPAGQDGLHPGDGLRRRGRRRWWWGTRTSSRSTRAASPYPTISWTTCGGREPSTTACGRSAGSATWATASSSPRR